MRNTIETIPYVRMRTFSDPTARIAVERATRSLRKWRNSGEHVPSSGKNIPTVPFENETFFNNPKTEGISAIKQRVSEIENILRVFNQRGKKHLDPEEAIRRKELLTELKRKRQLLV